MVPTPGATPNGLDKRALDLLAGWRAEGRTSWDSGFVGLIGRCVSCFESEGIEYMIVGSVAIRLHGGDPEHTNASLVMTSLGWQRVQEAKDSRFSASRDADGCWLSTESHAAGITFEDSMAGRWVWLYGVKVASLPDLCNRLLLRPGNQELASVRSLILANDLDESFRLTLAPRRRPYFLDCLSQARQTKGEPRRKSS